MSRSFYRMIVAAVAVPALVVAAAAAAEVRTPPAGGAGGGPFAATCRSGSMLRGLVVRHGSWIDAVAPICLQTGATGIDSAVSETVQPPAFGGSGGSEQRMACNRNTAVRELLFTHGMLTDHIRGVSRLGLECGSPDGRGPSTEATIEVGGPNKPQSVAGRLSCPPGLVATGIFGRSGQWLDQIGLICDRSPLLP